MFTVYWLNQARNTVNVNTNFAFYNPRTGDRTSVNCIDRCLSERLLWSDATACNGTMSNQPNCRQLRSSRSINRAFREELAPTYLVDGTLFANVQLKIFTGF